MYKYIDFTTKIDYNKLLEPAKALQKGKVIVFPTETVYGIGVNGLDEVAIKNLYSIKKRPIDKPISLLVNNISMIEKVAKNISPLEYKLINSFMPGPLTIILEKSSIVPNILTANSNTVGIRIPDNTIAKKLIEYSGVPIATPSANISGKPSGTIISDIINDFNDSVDYYIDGGKSKIGFASTIIQVVNETPKILREGIISKEDIEKVCKMV